MTSKAELVWAANRHLNKATDEVNESARLLSGIKLDRAQTLAEKLSTIAGNLQGINEEIVEFSSK